MTARQALELGTIGGVRARGLEGRIGSITPGKRADLVLIDPQTLNMAGGADPAHLVLECTLPENVDTVMIDARILKRGGKLTAPDTAVIVRGARGALDRVGRAASG